MSHTWNDYEADDVERAAVISHFEQCRALAESVDIHRLERPRRFDALAEVVTAVERDLS